MSDSTKFFNRTIMTVGINPRHRLRVDYSSGKANIRTARRMRNGHVRVKLLESIPSRALHVGYPCRIDFEEQHSCVITTRIVECLDRVHKLISLHSTGHKLDSGMTITTRPCRSFGLPSFSRNAS